MTTVWYADSFGCKLVFFFFHPDVCIGCYFLSGPLEKAVSDGYARELEIAVAGLKEMKRRGIKVTVLDRA